MLSQSDLEAILWQHLSSLPYFRGMLRAVEHAFYAQLDLPQLILDLGAGDGHFASLLFGGDEDLSPNSPRRSRFAEHSPFAPVLRSTPTPAIPKGMQGKGCVGIPRADFDLRSPVSVAPPPNSTVGAASSIAPVSSPRAASDRQSPFAPSFAPVSSPCAAFDLRSPVSVAPPPNSPVGAVPCEAHSVPRLPTILHPLRRSRFAEHPSTTGACEQRDNQRSTHLAASPSTDTPRRSRFAKRPLFSCFILSPFAPVLSSTLTKHLNLTVEAAPCEAHSVPRLPTIFRPRSFLSLRRTIAKHPVRKQSNSCPSPSTDTSRRSRFAEHSSTAGACEQHDNQTSLHLAASPVSGLRSPVVFPIPGLQSPVPDSPPPYIVGSSRAGSTSICEVPTTRVVGLDPWWQPLKEAQHRNVYHLLTQADAADMPFPPASFPCVISNSVLEHIPDLDPVLQEVHRVLEPGGLFVFCVPNNRFLTDLWGQSLLKKLGLHKLAAKYNRFFNRIARHHHLDPFEVWKKRLEAAGLIVESHWHYFPVKAMHILERGHLFGLPNLLWKKLFGRWVLFPSRLNPFIPHRRLLKFMPTPNVTERDVVTARNDREASCKEAASEEIEAVSVLPVSGLRSPVRTVTASEAKQSLEAVSEEIEAVSVLPVSGLHSPVRIVTARNEAVLISPEGNDREASLPNSPVGAATGGCPQPSVSARNDREASCKEAVSIGSIPDGTCTFYIARKSI